MTAGGPVVRRWATERTGGRVDGSGQRDAGTGARVVAVCGLDPQEVETARAALPPPRWSLLAAGSGRAALVDAAEAEPHVWLLAAGAAEDPGVLVQDVLALQSGAAVLLAAGAVDDDVLFAALRAGAAGFVPLPLPGRRLPDVLAAALDGEVVLPRALATRLARGFRRRPSRQVRAAHGRVVDLSPREVQVLQLLRAGLTTQQIGRRMHVADVTVRSHVAAVCRKLRVPDRRAALALLTGAPGWEAPGAPTPDGGAAEGA